MILNVYIYIYVLFFALFVLNTWLSNQFIFTSLLHLSLYLLFDTVAIILSFLLCRTVNVNIDLDVYRVQFNESLQTVSYFSSLHCPPLFNKSIESSIATTSWGVEPSRGNLSYNLHKCMSNLSFNCCIVCEEITFLAIIQMPSKHQSFCCDMLMGKYLRENTSVL